MCQEYKGQVVTGGMILHDQEHVETRYRLCQLCLSLIQFKNSHNHIQIYQKICISH